MSLLVSDHNLQRLDTKQLFAHIIATIEAGSNIAFFGQRGIGKTACARQATAEAKHHLVYMNLAVYERPDVAGYPNVFNSPDQFVHHLFPFKFKPLLEGDQKCVLFLDELDKADASLNAPLLELIEDHALNGTKFPNLVSVISTGNLICEGGSRPIPPLLDRTEKYMVEASVEAWLEWAGSHIHPSVLAFIHDKPHMLLDVADHPSWYATRSPRGWDKTSTIAKFGERLKWNVDMINEKACGFVGKQAGIDFQLYFARYQTLLPMVDAIINEGDYKAAFADLAATEQLYVAMIVSSRLAGFFDAHVKEANKDPGKRTEPVKAMLKATGSFYKTLYEVHPEFLLVCMQGQIKNDRWVAWDLADLPEWDGLLGSLNRLSR